MTKLLEQQIKLQAYQLTARREILQQNCLNWHSDVRRRLSSPKTLGIAFLSGFLVTLSSKASVARAPGMFMKLVEIAAVMALKKLIKQQGSKLV